MIKAHRAQVELILWPMDKIPSVTFPGHSRYRKIQKTSPRDYIMQKAFIKSLYLEGRRGEIPLDVGLLSRGLRYQESLKARWAYNLTKIYVSNLSL